MKKIAGIVVVLMLNLSAVAQSPLKEYSFNSYHFKIAFTQKPDFSADTSQFNNKPLVSYLWETNVEDSLQPNSYYNIGLTEYPSEYIHSDSALSVVEGFMNSTQTSLFKDSVFVLLTSSLIEKDGYPGKDYKWKNTENNMYFEFQVFLIGSRLFELSVVSRAGYEHNQMVSQFFNSFELVDIPKGSFVLPKNVNKRTFEIKFPEKPEDKTKIVDSEYGQLTLDMRTLVPPKTDENLFYIAAETRYPKDVIEKGNTYQLNTFYKNSISNSLNAVNGSLISIEDIYYDKHLGKEFRCYYSNGKYLMVYRLFYINSRLYNFGIITYPDRDHNKDMKRFFKSFKIKE
ncbi:MAG: hypothetical protein JXR65_04790 [Bacteroidales bacterium]|nr:hypothetical protein [Bacteroidales bacterium]